VGKGRFSALLLFVLVLIQAAGYAQSGLTGAVKDTSGAVIPGVTVEAASPVLIEKIRTVVTDEAGIYKIVDLRPGTYTMTFSLPGFTTVRREGIELPPSFTATINVEMRVGGADETITVQTDAPTVDVENVLQQRVLSQDLVGLMPSSYTPQALAALTPGVTMNLGQLPGNPGELGPAIHGGRGGESQIHIDGDAVVLTGFAGDGGQAMRFNMGYVKEISVKTGGAGADQETAGVVSNIIPKEGGNSISGTVSALYTGEALAADNLSVTYVKQGLTSVNHVIRFYDVTWGVGGPVKRDKLWFFVSGKLAKSTNAIAGLYKDLTPTGWAYTPDKAHAAAESIYFPDINGRLTWQASSRHKVSGFIQRSGYSQTARGAGATSTLETSSISRQVPNIFFQVNWTGTMSTKLLLESGFSTYFLTRNLRPQDGMNPYAVSIVEQTTGVRSRAPDPTGDSWGWWITRNYNYKANASYVTGKNTFQTGFVLTRGPSLYRNYNLAGGYSLRVRNGVPNLITQVASPQQRDVYLDQLFGAYAQDQWRIRNLTVNVGLRLDRLVGEALPTNEYAGDLVGPRIFAGVKDLPNFKDLNPRFGVAYDLLGHGTTALKASIGRYDVGDSTNNFTTIFHPVTRSVYTATRNWTPKNWNPATSDANGNIAPACDLRNVAANGDCAALSNSLFGQSNPNASTYDDNVVRGFGVRAFNWYLSAEVQRQVTRNSSVTVGYYRRSYGNFTVARNILVSPSDFDPFCVKAPVDSRLPQGGGYLVCGLYDVNQAKFGKVISNTSQASKFGKQTEIYNGFDILGNMRLPRNIVVNGGVNIGRDATNACYVVDTPQALLNCAVTPPFQTNARLVTSSPLPLWGLDASAVWLINPPAQITASYTAAASEVIGLDRPLSSGSGGTVTVPLIAPGTTYGDYVKQLDFRLTKQFKLENRRLRTSIDIFNLLNANTAQSVNTTFGPQWLRPTVIQLGRYFQFSGQFDF